MHKPHSLSLSLFCLLQARLLRSFLLAPCEPPLSLGPSPSLASAIDTGHHADVPGLAVCHPEPAQTLEKPPKSQTFRAPGLELLRRGQEGEGLVLLVLLKV